MQLYPLPTTQNDMILKNFLCKKYSLNTRQILVESAATASYSLFPAGIRITLINVVRLRDSIIRDFRNIGVVAQKLSPHRYPRKVASNLRKYSFVFMAEHFDTVIQKL